MCTECTAHCDYCGYQRHMSWERCRDWMVTFRRTVTYTHVFSSPDMPDPSTCPNKHTCVKMAIRPGSCPRGPTKAFLLAEKERRRGYSRHFGYADSDSENDDDQHGEQGCIGYEVRAELMASAPGKWDAQWSHQSVRERMGLEYQTILALEVHESPEPPPMLDIAPSSLSTEGTKPTARKEGEKSPEKHIIPPPVKTISWTEKLHDAVVSDSYTTIASGSTSLAPLSNSMNLMAIRSPRPGNKWANGSVMPREPEPVISTTPRGPRAFVHDIPGPEQLRIENTLYMVDGKKPTSKELVIPTLPGSSRNDLKPLPGGQDPTPASRGRQQEQTRPNRRPTTRAIVAMHNNLKARVRFANAEIAGIHRKAETNGVDVEDLQSSEFDLATNMPVKRNRHFNGPMMHPH